MKTDNYFNYRLVPERVDIKEKAKVKKLRANYRHSLTVILYWQLLFILAVMAFLIK